MKINRFFLKTKLFIMEMFSTPPVTQMICKTYKQLLLHLQDITPRRSPYTPLNLIRFYIHMDGEVRNITVHFFIRNSVASPSAWDFGQKWSNSLATAQSQIGFFLSKQFVFAKSCENQNQKLSNCYKQLLGSFSKISLTTPAGCLPDLEKPWGPENGVVDLEGPSRPRN